MILNATAQRGPKTHVASYYAATANSAPDRPALVGEVRADVCIVGAGFTGVSAALSLAENGIGAVVLNRIALAGVLLDATAARLSTATAATSM